MNEVVQSIKNLSKYLVVFKAQLLQIEHEHETVYTEFKKWSQLRFAGVELKTT